MGVINELLFFFTFAGHNQSPSLQNLMHMRMSSPRQKRASSDGRDECYFVTVDLMLFFFKNRFLVMCITFSFLTLTDMEAKDFQEILGMGCHQCRSNRNSVKSSPSFSSTSFISHFLMYSLAAAELDDGEYHIPSP